MQLNFDYTPLQLEPQHAAEVSSAEVPSAEVHLQCMDSSACASLTACMEPRMPPHAQAPSGPPAPTNPNALAAPLQQPDQPLRFGDGVHVSPPVHFATCSPGPSG